MLYFRTNILVLVLASLSLASWGGTISAQETTTVPVVTEAPISAADVGGADTGEMPILTGVDTPTEAPVAGGAVETPTEAPVVGGVDTSAMPSAPPVAGMVGMDYCTYSPDPTCYSNSGKPDCCLDDAIECPAEAAPCDVVGSETEAPTSGAATTTPPVAVAGADYCTYSPDPTCYSNSGKPDCCLDDAVECPVDAAPCDVFGSETEAPSASLSSPAPTGGAATTTPPVDVVNDDASAPPTSQSTDTSIIASQGPTQAPSAGVPLPGADYCTYSPDPACYSNSGKPECCLNEFIDCPDDKPDCDVVGSETEVPTQAPIVFAGFQKCSANDVCKEDGLEGNCCPNEDGTVLDCCYGITESPVAAGTDPSESPTSMTSGPTPTGGPIDAEVPTTSVPTTEAAVPAVTITTPPPQPETPTEEQTPPAPAPNDTSESSSSSNVDIEISAAVVSGVRFVAVAVGVVTTAVVAVL